MKRVLLSLFAAMLYCSEIPAQEHSPLMTIQAEENLPGGDEVSENGFRLGARFGLGEGKIKSDALKDTRGRLMVSGGIASSYRFNKLLSLNADFLLTSIGVKTSGYTRSSNILGQQREYVYDDRFDFLLAELPVTAQLTARSGNFFMKGYAGPSVNFNLIAVETREYDDNNYNTEYGYRSRQLQDVNTVSYSVVYGIGLGAYDRENRIYFLDFRLSNGISPGLKIGGQNTYYNYYCVSAGYYF